MKNYDFYINNSWQKSSSKDYFHRYTLRGKKQKYSEIICNKKDVKASIKSATNGLVNWNNTSKKEKYKIISKLTSFIYRNRILLAKLESIDTGKTFEQSLSEILGGHELWKYACKQILSQKNKKIKITKNTFAKIFHEPVGVVVLIIPWNFPFIVASERLPFILSAGCSVILKPSEYASRSIRFLTELIHKSNFPKGTVNYLSGPGNITGNILCSSKQVDMISFTGSTIVGKKIMRQSSYDLKKISLELGGKNPIIICEDADLIKSVNGVIIAFTHNSGQACVAGSRLYVHNKIYNKFIKIFIDKVKNIQKLNPITTQKQYEKLLNIYQQLFKKNIFPIFGKMKKRKDRVMDPLIYADAPLNSILYREELFGPIIVIKSFEKDDEAINLANNTNYGLSAMVWSKNLSRSNKIVSKINAGRIWINGSIKQNYPFLPIGGFKQSGIGRETGEEGIKTYSQIKTVIVNK